MLYWRFAMSLKTSSIQSVPAQTARVARAAFPKGNAYLTLRDELGPIFVDEDFLDLYPEDGQPALAPWQLALVTILQFREHLPDRQAAEAVRARIDWKYLLGLELTDPGFDFSVLSEFRMRLLAGGAEARLLEKLLARCREQDLIKARGKQRTDATRVLAAIRVMNRLELIGETIRATLNELSTVAPAWLQSVAPSDWYKRYSRRIEDDRLPQSQEKRIAYAQTLGEDGFLLLDRLAGAEVPPAWRDLPMVKALRLVLARHYERVQRTEDGQATRQVRFKENRELERAAEGIESPYDIDARYRSRYGTAWTGYIVHLTESCEEEEVHLITHVETTEATVHEAQKTEAIHQALVDKELPPGEHMVDSAYIDAELLVMSQKLHGITLIGPTRSNNTWQTKVEGAYDLDQFVVDWEQQQVRCPQGKSSTAWKEGVDNTGSPLILTYFRRKDCQVCPARELCTRAARRVVGFRPKEQYEALQAARQRHASAEGRQLYNRRAGIEGTISQGVRAFGLRLCRYRGLAKTSLQHIATAAAINFDRLIAWFNEIPQAQTRTSRFARLAPA
jgi:transposase